ncbi:methionyl-tRNA formyltransferase [Planktosalinus lacus]|uniref:Methionyl-tRNA formyltransferase n=1 Tax=Planktosalinus lacus TaxID=1526573 RepID=A0A8J2VDC0_9FLAO|nr:methionyl-tRNA formyltransferase [Planktosalinus lacus]GGE01487.1 methionyl-tRNA formyltransferase [Planktosalinus lacus]
MSDLRIIFYGTPHFAVTTLKSLIDNHKNVVAVVTAPDKPAGRGRSLKQSAVKEYALAQGLKILQPTNLKSEEFQSNLKDLQPDLQIVVAFRMLPESVWRLPKKGTFNLHASLLPQYRGAAPINWAIINGETKTGVTTFFIDDKIDTGEIILQREVIINPQHNAGELHDLLMNSGSQLVLDTVELIEKNGVKPFTQATKEPLKTAYKLHHDNTKIDWNKPVDQIHNLVRGLSPYPVAWCYLENGGEEMKVKIFKTTKEKIKHQDPPGMIFSTKKELKVAAKDGYIGIKEIQLPGKKNMHTKDLLNGFNFEANSKMR